MAIYKDSVGNVYTSLPKSPPQHKAKKRQNKPLPQRTYGDRKRLTARGQKYDRYRKMIGKPNGPGQIGNKSGKNKVR
jgi:hypothetical protein